MTVPAAPPTTAAVVVVAVAAIAIAKVQDRIYLLTVHPRIMTDTNKHGDI
jgi:hypothetical protein